MSTRNPHESGSAVPVDQLGRSAAAYAQRGIPVLPLHYPIAAMRAHAGAGPTGWSVGCSCRRAGCASIGKHPIGELAPNGVHDATTDPARIAHWWTRAPLANIGLATGHVFDVLDVDGPGGAAAIHAFATQHGWVNTGPLVRTGSGGWHHYLQPTGLGNRDPRGLEHVDWRGRGGYVVAPPSRHASGQPYQFTRDLDHPLPQAPAVLRARLEPEPRQAPAPAAVQPPTLGHPYATTALERECAHLAATPPDSKRRNQTLYLAGLRLHSLAAGGALDPAQVDAQLLAAAHACGLSQREARATIASARRTATNHPRSIPDRSPSLQGHRLRPAPTQPLGNEEFNRER